MTPHTVFGAEEAPAGYVDVALAAAEMAPWRYTLDDQTCVFGARAQALYGVGSPYLHDEANIRALLHPDDVEPMWQAVAAACDPAGDGRYFAEYRVRRPEGGWRWLSVWGLVEFESEGGTRRPVAITGASRDITDRQRARLFLEAQTHSLEQIINGAPLEEILTDLTRVVEEQAEGRVVASVLFLDDEGRLRNAAAPSLPPDYLAAIDGLKADPNLGTCSVAASTASVVITPDIDGDPRWAPIKHLPLDLGLLAAWSQPITARDGRVLGTFGTYFRERREPTTVERQAIAILSRTAALAIERARADEAAREADRRKDEFIATLSHELRNPLAPLRTALHVLRGSGADAEARERLLSAMDRQVTQLVRLVDDLLEVSRISRGAVELRQEAIDMASVVRLAVETTEPVLHAARHRLTLEMPPEPMTVYGDRVRLAQIIGNLLNNSAKYTSPGGHIVVCVTADAADVTVSVRDDGVGIEPAALPQLFELFVRGTRSGYGHREGLGIGLALARRLAEMHGGSLTGVSEGPGKGSEFTLRLPRVAPLATEAPVALGHQLSATALAARVLVVDDNVDAADMTAQVFAALGCETYTAYDGATALAVAARTRPSVILLDIGLPDMSGRDLCQAIRGEDWAGCVTIVAVTGWGQSSDIAESLRAGFDAHLVKPVDPDALTALLERHDVGRDGSPTGR